MPAKSLRDTAAALVEATLPATSNQQPASSNRQSGSASDSIVLPVLGMTCAACQRHVEAALRESAGVRSARVDLMRHQAHIDYDPQITGALTLVEAIRGSGYESALPRKAAGNEAAAALAGIRVDSLAEKRAGWKALITIGAGVAAMVLSMPLSMPLGMGATQSHGQLGEAGMGVADRVLMALWPWLFRIPPMPLLWGLLIATGALAVWAGGSIYRSAWRALLHRETNMNTLVSLGTGVAFLYSAWVSIWFSSGASPGRGGVGDVYFDSVLMILGFLLLGKWLETRARLRAIGAVDALARLQPPMARVRRDGGERMLPVEQVEAGDVVVILPGERVPVDAVVQSGRTSVDESMVTGEAMPVERGAGDRVLAGTLNYDGAIECRVEAVGANTTLSAIARLVEAAQSSRAPMERLADQASAIFVPVVLALAVATLLGWLVAGHDWQHAILSTVAVLVIACPCAMGLAVPAALTVAIGRGAQFGVLIKGGEALERLAHLDAVVMDKTGTLTLGKPTLVGSWVADGFNEEDLLRMAAAAEDRSAHPLAAAVVARAKEAGLHWSPAEAVQVIAGRGITAEVDGKRCLLGNAELLHEWAIPFPAVEVVSPAAGVTRLWMAVGGSSSEAAADYRAAGYPVAGYRVAGYFDARDTVRRSAAAAVGWLLRRGITVEMLTGDTASAAAPIATATGILEVASGLLPADKVGRIRAIQAGAGGHGLRVAMVGDGINDAAALAQADAGIAMGAGAALAQEAGDVLLLTSDPAGVVTAIALAEATVTVMRQNLVWAAAYNAVGIPLAAGLLYPAFHLTLTPWMAAAAMAFSSVSVLVNSLRLKGWRPPLASSSKSPMAAASLSASPSSV